jgi:hypothetical protein
MVWLSGFSKGASVTGPHGTGVVHQHGVEGQPVKVKLDDTGEIKTYHHTELMKGITAGVGRYEKGKMIASKGGAAAAEKAGILVGTRGGRYYVSATGAKVYVKPNPGPVIQGHMSGQRFVGGLPMSVHLAEPKRG